MRDGESGPPLVGLIGERDISGALRRRKSQYVFRTVPKPRISEYEGDGWEVAKKNKESCRMRKLKPHDVMFEDRVWTMVARLGWMWMNEDRSFRFHYTKSESGEGKQIDVFAADAETTLFVECKSAPERRQSGSSFAQDVHEISDIRKGLNDNLRKALGTRPKTAWLFFTRNYRVGEADQERFRQKRIFHIPEDELSYYEQLVAHLGPVAKYQLVGRLFEGQTIPELDTRVPALRARVAGRTVYSFLVEPELLLKLGYVLHRTSAIASDLERYQRLVNRARLREIRRYIVHDGGFFPNSVIVNIRAKSRLRFDLGGGGEHASQTTIGILHLPQKFHSAMIIDGQHRLFGYGQTDERRTHKIPVVAFVNLPGQEQADMFVTINATQRSVPQNLLMTLRAEFDWDSKDPSEATYAAEVRLVRELNDRMDSMLHRRIVLAEETKDEERCLTLRYLQREGLRRTTLLASVRQGGLVKGPPCSLERWLGWGLGDDARHAPSGRCRWPIERPEIAEEPALVGSGACRCPSGPRRRSIGVAASLRLEQHPLARHSRPVAHPHPTSKTSGHILVREVAAPPTPRSRPLQSRPRLPRLRRRFPDALLAHTLLRAGVSPVRLSCQTARSILSAPTV